VLIGLLDGQTFKLYLANDRKFYAPVILYKIAMNLTETLLHANTSDTFIKVSQRTGLTGIEHSHRIFIGWTGHEDGELILRLDGHVVEHGALGTVEGGGILEVGYVLVVGAGEQQGE